MKAKRLVILAAAFILALTLLPWPGGGLTVKADSGNPAIQIGPGALKNYAGTEEMQLLRFGGRNWHVIAYDGEDGGGNAITYQNSAGQTEKLHRSGTATLLQDEDGLEEFCSFSDNTNDEYANAYNGSNLWKFIKDK